MGVSLDARRSERLVHVFGQIGNVFEPDVDPQQALGHTHCRAGFVTHVGVGGGRRVAHQAARIADIVRNIDQLQRIEAILGGKAPYAGRDAFPFKLG